MQRNTHTIDATGKVLGRLAAEVAILLRGKHKPDFIPNKDAGDFVIVKNINEIKITGRKFERKFYYRHSGFLGGLKKTSLKEIHKNNPAEILKKAVFGMLPKNRLRSEQIKRLKFE